MIGKMSSQIIHEIRNLFSSIGFNTEFLGDEFSEFMKSADSVVVEEVHGLFCVIWDEIDCFNVVME